MYYDDLKTNTDINICFFSGKIVSEPNFKFFFNSKKYISKVSFLLKTENGFISSKKEQNMLIKIVAYNELADFVYRKFNINNKVIIIGYLKKDEIVIICNIKSIFIR